MELIGTIESDEEVENFSSDSQSEGDTNFGKSAIPEPTGNNIQGMKSKPATQRNNDQHAKPKQIIIKPPKLLSTAKEESSLKKEIVDDFVFEVDGSEEEDLSQSWDFTKAIEEIKRNDKHVGSSLTSLDEKIKNALKKQKISALPPEDSLFERQVQTHSPKRKISKHTTEKSDKPLNVKDTNFEERVQSDSLTAKTGETKILADSFVQLHLSRPLLKAIHAPGFEKPTPIQAEAIPYALQGRDICGSAVTGSGKTAAYLLPMLERLLFRTKRVAIIRVLILTPTRELAQQVHSMLEKLAKFTDVEAMVVVGGLSLQQQAARLRGRPDVVIATPGRLIDHVRNTQSVDVDNVEILILDEADRLLEMGFTEEVMEIVKFCPKSRQTLLFSATLTTPVNKLAELSLNRPVRVVADPLFDMARRLSQEFVRIRQSREGDREAILLSLCFRTFKTGTIIFFKRKVRAHRMSIIFGLVGLKAVELHGNLTQAQRLESLQKFRNKEVDFLLCTDVASRGLDIQGVKVVLNFEMPRDLTIYVHRVGRTARAGRGGVSVTLTGENQRKLMKEILKRSKHNVNSRTVPANIVEKYRERIQELEDSIKDVLQQEKVEREIRKANIEATKATNLLEHGNEIMSRPARTWFQTEKQKQAIKEAERKARLKADVDGDGDALKDKDRKSPKNARERRKERRTQERKAKKQDENKLPHRMTRKKRRRMEIRKYEQDQTNKSQQDAQVKGSSKQIGSFEKQQKRNARSAKREIQQEKLTSLTAPISTGRPKKKVKLNDDVVNLGLDENAERSDLIARRHKNSALLNKYNASETLKLGGLRKGGKPGSKKFKSKQKYNRKRR